MKNKTSLVVRIKAGNRDAFDELYRAYYANLFAYAKLILGDEEAGDVVQDVFLNVWLRREYLDESQSVRSYLLRAVYNTSLNILRHRKYSGQYYSLCEQEIKELLYHCYDPDTNEIIRKLYTEELQAEIDASINSLPPKCREVFSMSYLQDIPNKEISSMLGISLRTVENHIYTALKLLREKLAPYKGGTLLFCLFLINFRNNG